MKKMTLVSVQKIGRRTTEKAEWSNGQKLTSLPTRRGAFAVVRALFLIVLLAAGAIHPVCAQPQKIVDFELFTPIGGNQNFNTPVNNFTTHYNGDSTLDSIASVAFSETSVLSPTSPVWLFQPSFQNPVFYGGGEAVYSNTSSAAGFAREQVQNALPSDFPICFTANPNGFQSTAMYGAVIWYLNYFLNFDPATDQVVIDSASSLTMSLSDDQGIICPHRWIIRQGGHYYVSAVSVNTAGTQTLTDPSTTTWALYDPAANLRFNPASSFSAVAFTNVEGVGYYFGQDFVVSAISSRVSDFQALATITGGVTNNAPTNTAPATITGFEGTPFAIKGVSVNDPGSLWWTSLGVSSGTLQVSLAGGARIDSGANSSPTLTLTGNEVQINAALATLTYMGDTYSNGLYIFNSSDTLTMVSSDLDGVETTTNTVAIMDTPVNQAPVGTTNTVTAPQFTPYEFAVTDFGFTDPYNSPQENFLAVKITTLPMLGTLELNGSPVAAGEFVAVANIPNLTFTATNAGNPYTSFTFQVQNDGGTANDGTNLDPNPKVMTIVITPVAINQPPVGTANSVATFVNTPYTFAASDFGFTDPSNNPPGNFLAVEITTSPGVGMLAVSGTPVVPGQFVAVANIPNLTFTPVANAMGNPYTSFTFQVQNDGGTANGGKDLDSSAKTMRINVVTVNHPPVNTVPVPQTVTENTVLLISGVSVNDVDGNLSTTSLTVANGTLMVSLAGGATISAGISASASLTLSGTQAQINSALITLNYLGNTNYMGPDTLTVFSTDALGATASSTVAISVTHLHLPPAITLSGPYEVAGSTEFSANPLAISGVSVYDADGNLSQAKLAVTNGTLTLGNLSGATISAGANRSSSLTLSGTETQISNALVNITYQANVYFDGLDSLTVLATDTSNAVGSATASITVDPIGAGFAWDSAASGAGVVTEGPGNWNMTNTNWFDGTKDFPWPFTIGDDAATFGGGLSGTAGTILVGNIGVNSITFNPPFAGAYTLSGGTINLGQANSLQQTTPTINANANATIRSVLAGTNGLVINGPGQLTLGGSNTYAGQTTVNTGEVLRADWGVGVPTNGNLKLAGSLLEISQNLNSSIGASAGQIQMSAINSGFSAYGTSNVSISFPGLVKLPTGGAGSTLVLNAVSANQQLTVNATLTNNGVRSYIDVQSTTFPVILAQQLQTSGANVVIGKTGPGNLMIQGGWLDINTGHPYIYDGTVTINSSQFFLPTGTEFVTIGAYSVSLVNGHPLGTNGATFIVNAGSTVTGKGLVLSLAVPSTLTSPLYSTAYLNGGVTTVQSVSKGTTGAAAPNAIATLYLNGGTLQALNASSNKTFLGGLDNVYISSKGAVLDDGGFTNITISNNIQADPASPGGGLTKQDTGSIILAGAVTYTGPTAVKAGMLEIVQVAGVATNNLDISTAGAAMVKLDYSGAANISGLSFDGIPQPRGVYGGTGAAGATVIDTVHFAAGPGAVNVPTGPSPAPVLSLNGFSRPGGMPTLAFGTTAGFYYRMVYTTTLGPTANWLPVIAPPANPAPYGWSAVSIGASMTLTDPGATGAGDRFYRIEASTSNQTP